MAACDALIFFLALAAGLGGAYWAATHCGVDAPLACRLVAALCGVALSFTVFETAGLWLSQANDPWNAARLTPAVALHHGFQLYYPLHDGPVLSTVVGPVAFLAYWPVGFFPGSPTALILVACALNLIVFSALGIWLVRRLAARDAAALLAWLVGAQLVVFYASLRYSIFSIHSDAPALALGALGIGVIAFAAGPLAWSRALFSAVCFTFAVWSKQSLAPIFLAGLLIAGLNGGGQSLRRFLTASLGAGVLVSAAFVGTMGFSVLRDNMFAVPARHPWLQMSLSTGEIFPTLTAASPLARVKVLLAASLQLLRENWPLFALLLASGAAHLARRDSRAPFLPRKPWVAFLLVALVLFPTAAVGRVKLGGEVNHESFVVFFLVVAIVCWLAEPEAITPSARRLRLAVPLGVLLLVNAPRGMEFPGWQPAWDNQNEAAYRYDLAHPGTVYFPWNPLGALLVEGKLYHFDYGVFDRNLGGARVTPQHLARQLPAPQPVIASYLAHHDYILHEYFPDYRERAPIRGLPGWRIYGPPPETSP